jgi:hypothetical protein
MKVEMLNWMRMEIITGGIATDGMIIDGMEGSWDVGGDSLDWGINEERGIGFGYWNWDEVFENKEMNIVDIGRSWMDSEGKERDDEISRWIEKKIMIDLLWWVYNNDEIHGYYNEIYESKLEICEMNRFRYIHPRIFFLEKYSFIQVFWRDF